MPERKVRWSACWWVSGWLALGAAGCGSPVQPMGTVQGKLTYEGKPVGEATIQFQSPATGVAAATRVDKVGSYRLEMPLVVGKYFVNITPVDDEALGGGPGPPRRPKDRPDIPLKYRSSGPTGLSLTVSTGMNIFDANMTANDSP